MPSAVPTAQPSKPSTSQVAEAPSASVVETSSAVMADSEIKSHWTEVVAAQKPIIRALYSAVNVKDCTDGVLTLAAPSEMHISKSNEHLQTLLDSLKRVSGKRVEIKFVVAESKRGKSDKPSAPLDDSEIIEDVSQTTKAPNGSHSSPIDELAKAFPGSQIIDDKK